MPLFHPIIPPHGILCGSSPAVHPSRGSRTYTPLATTRQIRPSIRGPEGRRVCPESRAQRPAPPVSLRSPSGPVWPKTDWPSSGRKLTQSPPRLEGGRAYASIARPGRPPPPRPAPPTYGGRGALPLPLSSNLSILRSAEPSTAAIRPGITARSAAAACHDCHSTDLEGNARTYVRSYPAFCPTSRAYPMYSSPPFVSSPSILLAALICLSRTSRSSSFG